MLIPNAKPYRRRSRMPVGSQPPAPPPALTLVSATYASETSVTLTFDRAVNVEAFEPGTLSVKDGALFLQFFGSGVEQPLPTQVTVELYIDGEAFDAGVRLDVTGDNGIVDEAGNAWSGVENLSLPFGG